MRSSDDQFRTLHSSDASVDPPHDLVGKVSLVTGASRGIGAATTLALAKAGSDVVINYLKSDQAAEEVASFVKGIGRSVIKTRFDVSDFEAVAASIDRITAEMGHLDILVNNAGVNQDRRLLEMSKEEWDHVISVNLTGVFNVTKLALPHMIMNKWGRIVNISSIIANGNFGQSNYAASKAGIIGFSKSISKELASYGITVNVVAPGFTATDMLKTLPQPIRDVLVAKIPLKRFAKPQEIGDLVAYLCSPRADFITGEVFSINGGLGSLS